RPDVLNAYDVAMRDELYAVLGAADVDPEVRALVLRGSGAAFSTGGDVREFGSTPSPLVARAVRWRRDVWGRFLALRAATIAAVRRTVRAAHDLGLEPALTLERRLALGLQGRP